MICCLNYYGRNTSLKEVVQTTQYIYFFLFSLRDIQIILSTWDNKKNQVIYCSICFRE